MIKVQHLSKRYGDLVVLKDISTVGRCRIGQLSPHSRQLRLRRIPTQRCLKQFADQLLIAHAGRQQPLQTTVRRTYPS